MVVDPAGPPCPCGRRGCWERFASGAGLGRPGPRGGAGRDGCGEVVRLAGGDPESVRGEDVSAAAAAGDPAAQRVIEEVGWWVGFGLANLAGVLDPECFVLGGGLVRRGRPPGQVRPGGAFAELVEGGDAPPRRSIVPAAFGERAGGGRRAGGSAARAIGSGDVGDADRGRAADVPRHARRGVRRGRGGGRRRRRRRLLLRPSLAASASPSGRRWRPSRSSAPWRRVLGPTAARRRALLGTLVARRRSGARRRARRASSPPWSSWPRGGSSPGSAPATG